MLTQNSMNIGNGPGLEAGLNLGWGGVSSSPAQNHVDIMALFDGPSSQSVTSGIPVNFGAESVSPGHINMDAVNQSGATQNCGVDIAQENAATAQQFCADNARTFLDTVNQTMVEVCGKVEADSVMMNFMPADNTATLMFAMDATCVGMALDAICTAANRPASNHVVQDALAKVLPALQARTKPNTAGAFENSPGKPLPANTADIINNLHNTADLKNAMDGACSAINGNNTFQQELGDIAFVANSGRINNADIVENDQTANLGGIATIAGTSGHNHTAQALIDHHSLDIRGNLKGADHVMPEVEKTVAQFEPSRAFQLGLPAPQPVA